MTTSDPDRRRSTMWQRTLVLFALLGAVTMGLASQASAQDGPSITVEPPTVDAPGEYEFAVSGEGWAAEHAFLYACVVPPSGDAADVTLPCERVETWSDNGAGLEDDGTFARLLTFTVPAEGVCVTAADGIGDNDVAAACVTVQASSETSLASTGASSDVLTVVGVTALVAGAFAVAGARRLRTP